MDVPVIRQRTRLVYNKKRCRGKTNSGSCVITESYVSIEKSQSCKTGWIYEAKTDSCVPKCTSGCVNGTCEAPEVCTCLEPLVLRRGHCVEPTCSPACDSYSSCTDFNVCTCVNNTIALNGSQCAPVCPDGYYNDPVECSPRCERCVNGTCTEPGLCTCDPGYKNIDDVCVPKCLDCRNGECVAPNDCLCHDNYAMSNGTCAPVCRRACTNGACSEPDKCTCDDGYRLSSEDPFVCLPVCSERCVNSHCSSPNTCTCFKDYERNDTNSNVCYKKCDGACENGRCSLDGACECDSGYILSNGTCIRNNTACSANCSAGGEECGLGSGCPSEQTHFPAEVTSAGLAGLQISWLLGGAVGLLLLTLLLVVIHRTWRRRLELEKKIKEDQASPGNYSVMCSNPNRLLQTQPGDVTRGYSDDLLPTDETELTYEVPLRDESY